MTHGGFRHLIVLDDTGEPTGIVSVRDIIRCWAPTRLRAEPCNGLRPSVQSSGDRI